MVAPQAGRYPWSWSFWLFSAIVLGIAQSQSEISSAIEEGGLDYAVYLGPVWIKLLKDVFIVGLWAYLVILVDDPFPASLRRTIGICYAIAAFAFMIAFQQSGPLLALAGLRWILPLFLFMELRRVCNRGFDAEAIGRVLVSLLVVNLALQVLRLSYFPPIWGERWGMAARVPGFFLLPNTNAFFATACAAIVMDLRGRTHPAARLGLLLAVASALLSQSAGGLLACLLLFLYMLSRRLSRVLPIVFVLGWLFMTVAGSVLGRGDFLEYSGGERVEKLLLAAGELIGLGAFGAYTNTGVMLILSESLVGGSAREPVISDSFYVSLMGNLGFMCFPLTYLCWWAVARAARVLRRQAMRLGTASLLSLAIFSFSTTVTEAFPMVLILAFGAWMCAVPRALRRPGQRRMRRVAPAVPVVPLLAARRETS